MAWSLKNGVQMQQKKVEKGHIFLLGIIWYIETRLMLAKIRFLQA